MPQPALPNAPPPPPPVSAPLLHSQMPGVQPALSMDDVVESEPLLKANKQFQAFIAKRYGITDVENELAVDPWCALF